MIQGNISLFIISYVTDTMLGSGAVKINKVDNIPARIKLLGQRER